MHPSLPEKPMLLLGLPARRLPVHFYPDGRISGQIIRTAGVWKGPRGQERLSVELRFDDSCKNGHETFSITATHYIGRDEVGGGCLHSLIAERMPALAPLIKWHLCSTDGPMHYIGNTLYLAGDRDCWGLRKGEQRQIRNGRTGELCWHRPRAGGEYFDGPKPPEDFVALKWEPLMQTGEGKDRELDAARRVAIWPDAPDEILTAERDVLENALRDRLPALLRDFKAAMLACGFEWSSHAGY